MGQGKKGSTAASSVPLIVNVIVILFLLPSALSDKTDNIVNLFNCTRRWVLIQEATFSETASNKLCPNDGSSTNSRGTGLCDWSHCSEHGQQQQQQRQQRQRSHQRCQARFSSELLNEIYKAADSKDWTLQDRVVKKVNMRGGRYTVLYQCVGSRSDHIDPCEKQGSNITKTIAIFPMKKQSCEKDCTIHLNNNRDTPQWVRQFLVNNKSSTEDNSVSYKIVTSTKSLNWTRMSNPYPKKENIPHAKHVRMIKLRFRIESVLDVSRFWLNFADGKVEVHCHDAKETTAKPISPARHTTTPKPKDGKKQFPYLVVVPVFLGVVAVLVCLFIILMKSSNSENHFSRSTTAETSHKLHSTPMYCLRNADNQPTHFQNQAFSNTFDATDIAQPPRRAFPPLVGHVTGSGSDDRQYGTLDHYGAGRRGWRGEEDDYNHMMLPGSDGDYGQFQRGTGRQIVMNNPYDHTI